MDDDRTQRIDLLAFETGICAAFGCTLDVEKGSEYCREHQPRAVSQSLEEAIQTLISVGEKDPHLISQKVVERYGQVWLTKQLRAYAEEIIAILARQRLGSIRRSAEVALRPGDQIASAEMKVVSFWVPGYGWKPASKIEPDDLELRARMYDHLARGALRRSSWLRTVRDMMVAEGANTLGELKAPLPPLPDVTSPLAGAACRVVSGESMAHLPRYPRPTAGSILGCSA